MHTRFIRVALAAFGLSLAAVGMAASTPEATLTKFLNAAKTKDRKAVKSSIDWAGMASKMGIDKEKDPAKRRDLETKFQIIFVEMFAGMGKQADVFQVGNVSSKGSEASGAFMKKDPTSHKLVPTTQFFMHKKGGDWQIYNITSSPRTGKGSEAH